jgi:hypothetical protein
MTVRRRRFAPVNVHEAWLIVSAPKVHRSDVLR